MPHIGNFPVPAYPKPLVIPPSACVPWEHTTTWRIDGKSIHIGTGVAINYYWGPVSLPQGVTIEKLTLSGYRTTEGSTLQVFLYRHAWDGTEVLMGMVNATWTDGWNSAYVDVITSPKVDNVNYKYSIRVLVNPDAAPTDCLFGATIIDWK